MRSNHLVALTASVLAVTSTVASAAEPLRVSVWGGSWRDTVAETVGEKFTEETGVEVEYVTGGTMDRLNRAQLAKGDPETDITFTTSHVGWLYANSGLFQELDPERIPNAASMFEEGRISEHHYGAWSYVYTIGYRPDMLPEGVTFDSWEDLWSPELEGMIALPDFDPSHIIAVSAMLEGADIENWREGTERLKALRPNIKSYYSSDGTSQQGMQSGDTPVQVLLSGNAFHQMDEGVPIELVIPEEGAVVGIDTVAINAGTERTELAYEFINYLYDPEVQAEIAELKKLGPMNPDAEVPEDIASLPGVFTTPEEWEEDAFIIDHQQRAQLLSEWKEWFTTEMTGM
ncbi:MAG: ABC transporter substrate-binding protein [Spiribacter salinus]|uniref:ABC transporter substrate-binding protein n=1 Tax=Spiribacter salinus TaxID=1335746 RepID=A0A540VRC9_9GAMM|nr:MAG: ABC transporter substrate-binding protein [Spiribacter salinus]